MSIIPVILDDKFSYSYNEPLGLLSLSICFGTGNVNITPVLFTMSESFLCPCRTGLLRNRICVYLFATFPMDFVCTFY